MASLKNLPSLKLSAAALVVGLLVGLWLGSQKPQPQVEVKQSQAAQCKTVIVREIRPDGSKTETTEFVSEVQQEQKVDVKPQILPKYGIGLFHDKSVMVEYRLQQSPLFVIGEYEQSGAVKIGIKYEF